VSGFDRIIEHEIDTANDHLPLRRKMLREIVESGQWDYQTRGGETSVFRQEEIEYLKSIVPSELQSEIHLPIIILRRTDLGKGLYTIAGCKAELFLVNRIVLGYDDLRWDELGTWKPAERLVRPEVQILRKKLPSTTTIGFTMTTDDSQYKTEC
jgi:uncharacterized protein (UPF0216 family)